MLLRRRAPVVRQLSSTECGLACLVSVLRLHGHFVSINDVRDRAQVGRDGLTAATLVTTAESFGLVARGLSMEYEDLADLDTGAVLHWRFSHYVVLNRYQPSHLDVMDPALGRCRVATEAARAAFTGVAVVLEPGPRFEPRRHRLRLPPIVRSLAVDRELIPAILVASLAAQAFTLMPAFLTRAAIDVALPAASYDVLLWIVLASAVSLALSSWVTLVRSTLLAYLRTRLDSRFSHAFIGHLLTLPFAFFQTRSASDLIVRLASNATIRELINSAVMSVMVDGVLITAYTIALLLASWQFAAVSLGLIALHGLLILFTRRKRVDINASLLHATTLTNGYQLDVLSGIESIKASGLERIVTDRWLSYVNSELNVSLTKAVLDSGIEAVALTIRGSGQILMLLMGCVLVLRGDMSIGAMVSNAAIAVALLIPASNLLASVGRFSLLATYFERLSDVLDRPGERSDAHAAAPLLNGHIELKSVSYKYSTDSPFVLSNVSLEIQPGEFVAIVGRSGSGKSTLARVLSTVLAPTAGQVLLDGRDASLYDPPSLRIQFGTVAQNAQLFGLSIRDNIAGADPSISSDAIVTAASLSCIAADIDRMPMRYSTILLDRGSSISGGQQQRLAVARALVRRPRVLVLDEATSHLDTVTEAELITNIRRLGVTTVLVAHRLSTVVGAHQIAVMDAGRIVDVGDHASLLGRCVAYSELVRAQMPGTAN